MDQTAPSVLPETPPAELLAELDAAARVLDGLARRDAELTLVLDDQRRSVRFELADSGRTQHLTPTQLLDLLAA